jgi:putative restriction endonuclease
MNISLRKSREILTLSRGDAVTKRNLFDLIQYSKVEGSQFWDGVENRIGNTPQQGINWIGMNPICIAVLIKTRVGSYDEDGWVEGSEDLYRYSFKSVKGRISYAEKANAVLINQPKIGYPILLFIESRDRWIYQGSFGVTELHDGFVVLSRGAVSTALSEEQLLEEIDVSYIEGDRRYVTHLMAERNKKVVSIVKSKQGAACDICELNFFERYGVECIEAHHKKPISTYCSSYIVAPSDFALLCPSCHRAVHKYMRVYGGNYLDIKKSIVEKFGKMRDIDVHWESGGELTQPVL